MKDMVLQRLKGQKKDVKATDCECVWNPDNRRMTLCAEHAAPLKEAAAGERQKMIDRISEIAEGIASSMETRPDLSAEDRAKLVRLANALEEFSQAAQAFNERKGRPS